jgi:hypothetical protein
MNKDTSKASNPKDMVGIKKAPMSTVPTGVLMEVGVAMLEGALKYGRHNYRSIGVRSSVYYDAALRHLGAWWEGEDRDPDSGLSHITKCIASLVVLRDAMRQGNLNDDRPPREVDAEWMLELNKHVAALQEKYPDPKDSYTHENTRSLRNVGGSTGSISKAGT